LRLIVVARASRLRQQPVGGCIAAAALACLLALGCFAAALAALLPPEPSFDFNEALMWGGGHVLQFVNMLLLVATWSLLAAPLIGGLPTAALAAASGLLLLAVLPAPAFYLLFPPFSMEQTRAFTWLQYALGPAAAVMAMGVLQRLPRPWPWREPSFQVLALSMLLFAVGGTLGLFVDGTDTRTPAHYHGVIASITLAFFGLFFFILLPMLRRQPASLRRVRLIVHLFAWGQLAACVGLFIAGGHGAPRKVAGEAQGLVDLVPIIGMGLNGMGGLIAVIGGVMFVWTAGTALLRRAAIAPAVPASVSAGSGLRSGGGRTISRRTRG
jgi:cytochrome c oxidase subunit 1